MCVRARVHPGMCDSILKYVSEELIECLALGPLYQYEFKCAQFCVPESLNVGTYTVLYARISKNMDVHSVVYWDQQE